MLRQIAKGGSAEMSDDLYTPVGYQVEVTADWRRRQAEYFPDDDRKAKAAKELERLAWEVDQLEGSSVHEQIRLATDRLKDEDWFAMRKAFTPSYAQSVLTVPTRVACDSWNGIAIGYGGDPTRCRRKLFFPQVIARFLGMSRSEGLGLFEPTPATAPAPADEWSVEFVAA
jgi:hypothetical protein